MLIAISLPIAGSRCTCFLDNCSNDFFSKIGAKFEGVKEEGLSLFQIFSSLTMKIYIFLTRKNQQIDVKNTVKDTFQMSKLHGLELKNEHVFDFF